MDEIINEQCRTCLLRSTDMIALVADHVVCDKVMSVLDLLKTCTSVQIDFEDGYPQFVCLDCIRSAEKSYEFRVQCEKADNSLKLQIPMSDIQEIEDDEIETDNEIEADHEIETEHEIESDHNEFKCVIIEEQNVECEETVTDDYEYDNDDNHMDLNCLEMIQNSTGEIKCEEVDIIEVEEAFSCLVCDLIFPTSAALAKHSSSAHPPNFHQCPHCPVRFITQELLEKHVIKHTTKTTETTAPKKINKHSKRKRTVDYICAVCGKKYASLASLRLHIRKHSHAQNNFDDTSNQTVFICNECDHHFVTAADLQMHMETMHNFKSELDNQNDILKPTKFRCKICFKIYSSEIDLEEHINTFHEPRKKKPIPNPVLNKVAYKCKICSHEVGTLAEIKDHLSTTHDIDSKSLFQHLLYKCSECQTDCDSIYAYFNHMSLHGTDKIENTSNGTTRVVKKRPYKCNVIDCNKAFPSPSALKNHLRTHESQWPKKCRYCEMLMNKWHDYMTHLNEVHDENKTFVCSQCGKKFFRERNLQSHLKTHTGERNFMCDFCGFSFQAQNNLVAHRRLHTGVKPYKCTYCPQAFSQHAGLRSHLLNHTGEKKHECQTCHKKFLRIGALKTHVKTHTGVKDYACHICGARFGASSTRKKHLLTHTGERNHICDFCGKAFSRRSNLSVHRKIHTGETPHICEICGKGFIQAHVLRSHMNTHKKLAGLESTRKSIRKEKSSVVQKVNIKTDETEELTVLVEFPE